MAFLFTLFIIIQATAVVSDTTTDNINRYHEKKVTFVLDAEKEIPIIRSINSHKTLIERNHTMFTLCKDVNTNDRTKCILSIEKHFENMFTAIYLDYVHDLDKFIESSGFDLLHVEGGSSKFLENTAIH